MSTPSSEVDARRSRGVAAWVGVYARGIAMGVAELVPGVSGGTIAFITGIYLELVGTLRRLDHRLAGCLLRGRFAAGWRCGNLGFLVALGAGMASSLVTLSAFVHWAFAHHEIYLWSFFFGLILGSVAFIARFVHPWRPYHILLGIVGLLAGAALTRVAVMPAEGNSLVTFGAGAAAFCAWILPGVSGSFILLLLGQYQHMVKALSELDLGYLVPLAAGGVVGLLSFSRLLAWLLRNHYAATLAVLCGVMAGSLQKLWPWRQTRSYFLGADGDAVPLVVRPITPTRFQELYGDDPLLLGAAVCALAGMAIVVGLDVASRRRSPDGGGHGDENVAPRAQ